MNLTLTEYRLGYGDHEMIIEAGRPSKSPEEIQRDMTKAWTHIGHRLGFDPATVQPHPDRDLPDFLAVPILIDAMDSQDKLEEEAERIRWHRAALNASIDEKVGMLKQLDLDEMALEQRREDLKLQPAANHG